MLQIHHLFFIWCKSNCAIWSIICTHRYGSALNYCVNVKLMNAHVREHTCTVTLRPAQGTSLTLHGFLIQGHTQQDNVMVGTFADPSSLNVFTQLSLCTPRNVGVTHNSPNPWSDQINGSLHLHVDRPIHWYWSDLVPLHHYAERINMVGRWLLRHCSRR